MSILLHTLGPRIVNIYIKLRSYTGGAGGKGVWGKLGSELEEEDIDRNDPNYDSDSLEHGEIELATVIPEAPDEELRVSC